MGLRAGGPLFAVRDMERALAFYRRMGFAAEARTADDGQGNALPLLHMRLARQG